MTKDHILSWTLILLVGISLFLSFAIWSQVPIDLLSINKVPEEKNIDLASIVEPEKIVVYLGDSLYLGNSSRTLLRQSSPFYDEVLDISRNLLPILWTTTPESTDINRDFFINKKGVEIVFPTPLPTSFLKQLFDVKSSDTSSFDTKLISSYILIDDGELNGYLVDNEGLLYKLGKGNDSKELVNLIKDITDSNPNLYATLSAGNVNLRGVYVSLLPYEIPKYSVKRETIPDERMIARFFNDISVTRRIHERDGAVIYTDGQRGLRIYPNGALEYNYPVGKENKRNVSFYEALKIAVDYVNNHGGWPQGSYLAFYEAKTSQTGNYYEFKFGIRANGYSIIDEDNHITVAVEGTQVKNYYRYIIGSIKQQGLYELMDPIKALDVAVSTKNIRVVDDIYPGYIIIDDMLKPTWVVRTAGMEVVIQDPSE